MENKKSIEADSFGICAQISNCTEDIWNQVTSAATVENLESVTIS